MIKGVHTMFFTSQADELRAFIRDKLGFDSYVDAGGGWLIFDAPRADIGCHPLRDDGTPASGTAQISFYCDDIHRTVAELKSRGVRFTDEVSDAGYALSTHFEMPGDFTVELFQPHYSTNTGASRGADEPAS